MDLKKMAIGDTLSIAKMSLFDKHVIKFFKKQGNNDIDKIAALLSKQILKEGSSEYIIPLAKALKANPKNLMDVAKKITELKL